MNNILEAIKTLTPEKRQLRPILKNSEAKIAELPAPPQQKLLAKPVAGIYNRSGYIKVKKHDFL